MRGGWWSDYSLRCQPVDYSDNYKAKLILHSSYVYFISKFFEFIDTVCNMLWIWQLYKHKFTIQIE